jgi:hypothetical protein
MTGSVWRHVVADLIPEDQPGPLAEAIRRLINDTQ